MVSIQRCFKLFEIPIENEESRLKTIIPEDSKWPSSGRVEFKDV